MWFVNLQKGTGYSPTCKYIHSDKENIVHFTSQHQRRQTFSPTSLAAGRRVQHQDKPSNNTPWFCSLHTPLRFVSSWLILLLLKFAKPNSWLTWPLNCYTGDIWHSLNCSKLFSKQFRQPRTFKEGQRIVREQISYTNEKFIIPARLEVSNVRKLDSMSQWHTVFLFTDSHWNWWSLHEVSDKEIFNFSWRNKLSQSS